MPVELIVFDLAGTTVKDNRDVHRVLQHALARHGVMVTLEDANDVMGYPKPIAIDDLLKKRYTGDRTVDEEWIAAIHRDFVVEMIDFYRHDPSVQEKDGVTETFLKLRERNIRVVVDTGFDRQIVSPLLQRLGWVTGGVIDGSVTSDEVNRGRPFPDMIYKAMALTGVNDNKRVVKVGDTPSDLQQGTSAGCYMVVGVTTGAFSREALAQQQHTHLIENVGELLEIIS